jgi:biofilm PGA synthesis N-glycosyltransferase PgaC
MIYSFFWVSIICILVCWVIYPVSLFLFSRLKRKACLSNANFSEKSFISFIVASYNEEKNIKKRIENLIEIIGSYPFEIIIGSDGSTDKTVKVAQSCGLSAVRVLDFKKNRGRAMVHNDCSEIAKGDILIFTDAETVFARDFIELIIRHFADDKTGAVAGRIQYLNENNSDIGKSAGIYWRYEEYIRTCESKLGILGFGTGAALAIRKEAYEKIRPNEDIDYASTLLAAAKGYNIVYEPKAMAYDYISESSGSAFKTRIRQTSRCFKCVLQKIFSKNIFLKRFDVFIAALLHKTFRHLTPFFMIFSFVCNVFLIGNHIVYDIIFLTQLLFYLLSFAGYIFQGKYKGRFRAIFSFPFNFTLYNISRFIGVWKAVFGKETSSYITTR